MRCATQQPRIVRLPPKTLRDCHTASDQSKALPILYVCAAQSYIQTIVVGHMPPNHADGVTDYTRDPIFAAVGAYDGTSTMIDLRDSSATYEVVQTRSTQRHLSPVASVS